jgi:hypothetical protein
VFQHKDREGPDQGLQKKPRSGRIAATVLGLCDSAAVADILHHTKQGIEIEWLGDRVLKQSGVVCDSQHDRRCRHGDHGCLRVPMVPQLLREFDARHLWQHDIQQEQVWLLAV